MISMDSYFPSHFDQTLVLLLQPLHPQLLLPGTSSRLQQWDTAQGLLCASIDHSREIKGMLRNENNQDVVVDVLAVSQLTSVIHSTWESKQRRNLPNLHYLLIST